MRNRCLVLIAVCCSCFTVGMTARTSAQPKPLVDRVSELADKDPKVRVAAAQAFFGLYAQPDLIPKVAPALLTALKDSDDDVRLHAATALTSLSGYPHTAKALAGVPGVASALADALGDKKVEVAMRAADTLRVLGPVAKPAVPALEKALVHENAHIQVRSAIALVKADPTHKSDAARVLVAALSEKDDHLLVLVAQGLLDAGTAEEQLQATDILLSVARKPYTSYNQVESACFVMLFNPPMAGDAFKELARHYKEAVAANNEGLRQGVDRYLRIHGALAKLPVPVLLDLLADKSTAELHYLPTELLAQAGKTAIPELVAATKSDSSARRDAALTALIRIAPDLAVKDHNDALSAALRAPGGASRQLSDAVMGLGPQAAPLLEAAIAGQDGIELLNVAQALATIDLSRGAAGVPIFVKALESQVPNERAAAAGWLGAIGAASKPALPKLLPHLKDADLVVRITTANALIAIAPDEAAPAVPVLAAALPEAATLAKSSRPGQNTYLTEVALSGLLQLGPKATEAVPAILIAIESPRKEDRSKAVDALLAIQPASAKKAIPVLETGLQQADVYQQLAKLELIARLDPATAKSHAAILRGVLKHAEFFYVRDAGRLLLRLDPDAATKQEVAAILLIWCNKKGPEQNSFRYLSIPLLVTAIPVDAQAYLPWLRKRMVTPPEPQMFDERVSAATALASYGGAEAEEAVAFVEKLAWDDVADTGMICCTLADFPAVAQPEVRAALVRLSKHPTVGSNAQQMLKMLDAKKVHND